MSVLLASVARLDGRLGAVYVLCDGIRRSQTVPCHMVWPAAAETLDGRERSDVKTTSAGPARVANLPPPPPLSPPGYSIASFGHTGTICPKWPQFYEHVLFGWGGWGKS